VSFAADDPGLAKARRLRRLADRLTLVGLLATAVAVTVVAAPPLLRALGPEPAEVARRGIARTMRTRGHAWGPGAGYPGSSLSARGGPRHGTAPRQHKTTAELEGELADWVRQREGNALPNVSDAPLGDDPHQGGKLAFARRAVRLRLAPDEAAETAGEVAVGQLVVVAKDEGSWLLVAGLGDGGVVMGWTERANVVVGDRR